MQSSQSQGSSSYWDSFLSYFQAAPAESSTLSKELKPIVSDKIFKKGTDSPNNAAASSQTSKIILHSEGTKDTLRIDKNELELNNAENVKITILKITENNNVLAQKIMNFITKEHEQSLITEIQQLTQVNGKHLEFAERPPLAYTLQRFPGADSQHPIIILSINMKGDVEHGTIVDDRANDHYELSKPAHVVIEETFNFSTDTSELYYEVKFSPEVLSIYKNEQKLENLIKSAIEIMTNNKYLSSEGIFRLAGSTQNRNDFLSKIPHSSTESLQAELGKIQHKDTLAAILKNLIKERKLIPDNLVPTFLGVANSLESLSTLPDSEQGKIKTYLKQMINSLPPNNRELLKNIVDMSLEISSHSDVGKMTNKNIGIVLAPNIFQLPASNDMKSVTDMGKLNDLFTYILDNRNFLFDESSVASSSGA